MEVFKIQLNSCAEAMSINDLLLAKCHICSCEDHQTKIIFKQLRRKMTSLLPQLPHKDSDTLSPDFQGFQQLLRVLGVVEERKGRGGVVCKHLRLFKMFLKSLNCNWNTLQRICEITAAHLAERTYSLSLLEAQLKNAADRVGNDQVTVLKVEEKPVSLKTIPSMADLREGVLAPTASQTSLDEMATVVMPFPFYSQFPLFFPNQ